MNYMVQSDNKLATLEEEMKLLKTEISRTLIDLRALVMADTAPFREAGSGRLPSSGSHESPSTVGTDRSEAVRQVAPEAVPVDPSGGSRPQQPAMAAQPPLVPGGLAYSVPQVPPVPQPFAYPDGVGADQERRIIEQERRMAEQDRRMVEQESRMAEMGRGVSARDMGSGNEERISRRPGVRGEHQDAEYYDPVELRHPGRGQHHDDKDGDEGNGTGVLTRSEPADSLGQSVRRQREEPHQDEPDQQLQPNHNSATSRGGPKKSGRSVNGEQNQHLEDNSERRNGPRGSVYDEYAELFGEVPEQDHPEDPGFGPLAVDVNLISCLVGWTSVAKRRVGQERLNEVVELYLQTRCPPPGLRELLTVISDMVGEVPQGDGTGSQESVDLLAQLHGILAQDLPLIEIPRMPLVVSG